MELCTSNWKLEVETQFRVHDIKKDADPGIPEIEDAKKRVAGLKGE